MKRKDGTVFDSEHCVTPIHDCNGNITCHVSVVRDITERMRTDLELKRLVQEQGVILDNACVGITLTKDRRFVWVNNRCEEMFGYVKDEMVGKSTALIYPSEAAFELSGKETYNKVCRGELYTSELELRRKDGSIFWAKYYGKAIDTANISAGTIWIMEDIDAHRKTDQALIEKSLLLKELNDSLEARIQEAVKELRQKDAVMASQNRLLVDLAPEAIIVLDAESGRIVDANVKAEQLFGYSREILLSSDPLQFYSDKQPDGRLPAASFYENADRVVAGEVFVIERSIKGAHGIDTVCEVRLVRLPSPDKVLIRASFFDITERTKAQQELAKALDAEHRLNKEQRQFMGLVSHELRTPLAIVDGTAQLLVMQACKDSDCLRHATTILASTKRLSSLIDTCLTDERLRTSGWTPVMVPADISLLLRNVIMHAQVGSARHLIHSELEELPEQYACDPLLLQVMFNNLLDNAIKYSPDGGEICVRGWNSGGGELCFEVADQGVGIPHDQFEKVFDRFYRIGNIPEIAGAGLGLHIVKRIAELHGGAASCSSGPGKGAVFAVRLRSKNGP